MRETQGQILVSSYPLFDDYDGAPEVIRELNSTIKHSSDQSVHGGSGKRTLKDASDCPGFGRSPFPKHNTQPRNMMKTVGGGALPCMAMEDGSYQVDTTGLENYLRKMETYFAEAIRPMQADMEELKTHAAELKKSQGEGKTSPELERKLTKLVKSQKDAVGKLKKQVTTLAEKCSYSRYGRTRARGVEEIDFDNIPDDFWTADPDGDRWPRVGN